MTGTRTGVIAALMAMMMIGSAPSIRAQSSLSAARDLYAAAAYDEALNVLNALSAGGASVTDSGTVALYRALCLYALGRSAEGDRAVEALVEQHPLFRPTMDDLSPRMRTTVAETRRRLLPGLLQQKYADAKAAYERQEWPAAVAGFTQVIEGLTDPDISLAAGQSPLADLGTLAAGFRDLAETAMEPPPPAPTPIAPGVILPAPVVTPVPPRVYSSDDSGVTGPVAVRQSIPTYTRPVTQKKTAVVEVVVDENGAVEAASMLSSLDAAYDKAVVAAARSWQYAPATVDGKPVKYRKRVQITVVPQTDR